MTVNSGEFIIKLPGYAYTGEFPFSGAANTGKATLLSKTYVLGVIILIIFQTSSTCHLLRKLKNSKKIYENFSFTYICFKFENLHKLIISK